MWTENCRCPYRDDLAIGLDGNAFCLIPLRSEVRQYVAAVPEGAVTGTIGIKAFNHEIAVRLISASAVNDTGGHDLPVCLEGDGVRPTTDAEGHAAAGECRVEGPVRVVTGDHHVVRAIARGEALEPFTRGDDLSVGLQRRIVDRDEGGTARQHRYDFPVAAERRVECPVDVVTGQLGTTACRNNLPVGLNGHGVGGVVAVSEIGRHLAVAAEGRIQRPVCVEPGDGEVGSARPTETILPSAWIATALAWSRAFVKSVVTFPSSAKVESKVPSVL